MFASTAYGRGAVLMQLEPSGDGGVNAKELYWLDQSKLQNHHGGMVLIGDYVYGGHDESGDLSDTWKLSIAA